MKLIDTFMFLNEYDLLELRLSEHYDHVDKFIIIECDRTYTGIYKGFNLEKNLDRYSNWLDKIEYIKVDNSAPYPRSWDTEEWQRNQMNRGWEDVQPDDVLLISDLDEIIRPETLEYIKNTNHSYYELYLPTCYFKFNYMNVKDHYSKWAKAFRGYVCPGNSMRYSSGVPGKSKVALHHAGWHFSWLGNEDFIKTKIKSFSHTEYNNDNVLNNINLEENIKNGRVHIHPEHGKWEIVKLDDYFPKSLINNKEKYADYILPDSDKTVKQYWSKEILEQE
jgi:hypothetical protein